MANMQTPPTRIIPVFPHKVHILQKEDNRQSSSNGHTLDPLKKTSSVECAPRLPSQSYPVNPITIPCTRPTAEYSHRYHPNGGPVSSSIGNLGHLGTSAVSSSSIGNLGHLGTYTVSSSSTGNLGHLSTYATQKQSIHPTSSSSSYQGSFHSGYNQGKLCGEVTPSNSRRRTSHTVYQRNRLFQRECGYRNQGIKPARTNYAAQSSNRGEQLRYRQSGQVNQAPARRSGFGFTSSVTNDHGSESDDVVFVSETRVPEAEKRLAKSLELPTNYFAYKYSEKNCLGFVDCDQENRRV